MSTEMLDRIEQELTPFEPAPLERSSGNYWLIETLRRWGITTYAGVNGGGLIHVTKHLQPFSDLSEARDGVPRMLTMGEYVAGFMPLGHYLASGCVVIDDVDTMEEQLERAQSILLESKPVAICFYPDIISKDLQVDAPARSRPRHVRQQDVERFIDEFPRIADGRRVVIYVS